MPRRLNLETAGNAPLIAVIKEVLNKFSAHLPLTVRQVYYQLVGAGTILNNIYSYRNVVRLLVAGRLKGEVDWDAIEDRVRRLAGGGGSKDVGSFIERELESFLKYYSRDLTINQPRRVEVWIEKDALSTICERAADKYNIPVAVCRGFSSISFLHDFKERVGDMPATILYFGDFDPSGRACAAAVEKTLRAEMDVRNVKVKWCALTPQDIKKYRLPHNPDAIKKGDSRSAAHVAQYGKLAVELDALPPDVLVNKVKRAIEDTLDMAEFRRQKEQERKDEAKISGLRERIDSVLAHAGISTDPE